MCQSRKIQTAEGISVFSLRIRPPDSQQFSILCNGLGCQVRCPVRCVDLTSPVLAILLSTPTFIEQVDDPEHDFPGRHPEGGLHIIFSPTHAFSFKSKPRAALATRIAATFARSEHDAVESSNVQVLAPAGSLLVRCGAGSSRQFSKASSLGEMGLAWQPPIDDRARRESKHPEKKTRRWTEN